LKPLPRDLPLATPLSGAVVVLDVASGEVLAMVSAPSFPHRAMETGGGASLILGDEDRKPYLNRAIAVPYPPGSIVKPIILCGAMTAGKLGLSERIDCTGHFFPDKPLLYRCWIYKQFHTTHNDQLGEPPDGREAIQVSCNIFFFEAARRLGVQGVNDWYTRFGVGGAAEPWDLYAFGPHPSRTATETDTQWATRQAMDRSRRTLAFEYPGTVPDPEKATISEAILMGIGQGPIAWTPLHAADAYATIARGGVRLSPRLMAETPQKRTDLGIARAAIAQALAGLRASASEPHGTTFEASYEMPDGSRRRDRIFNTPGITIWAKSGTADSNPFKADYRDTGADETFDGDHAWCVYLAGTGDTPKYAVAVVVEHGGSGGRVAGPLANQVVQALVAEGYLPAVKPPLPEATTDAAAEGM
jgi:penicillin-binding protein 2